jgi:hypothetical protein
VFHFLWKEEIKMMTGLAIILAIVIVLFLVKKFGGGCGCCGKK